MAIFDKEPELKHVQKDFKKSLVGSGSDIYLVHPETQSRRILMSWVNLLLCEVVSIVSSGLLTG